MTDTFHTQNQGQQFPLYDEPLSPVGGIQTELPILLAEYTFYDEQDVQDYLALLAKLPDYLVQAAQYGFMDMMGWANLLKMQQRLP